MPKVPPIVIVGLVDCAVKLYQTSELLALHDPIDTFVAPSNVPGVVVQLGLDDIVMALAHKSFEGGATSANVTMLVRVNCELDWVCETLPTVPLVARIL